MTFNLSIIKALATAALASIALGSTAGELAGGNWPDYHGDWRGWRYSPLDQINKGNVKKLKVAFTWAMGGTQGGGKEIIKWPFAGLEGTPVAEDGFLYITGRIKEQYKLENGKYVVPTPLEEQIKLSPYVLNAMVYGDNKPFNVALVVANLEALKAYDIDIFANSFRLGGLGDKDALDRLERVLEQAGDRDRLVQTLEYRASAAAGPAERARVLRRLAAMVGDDGDDLRALELLEQALRAAPTDGDLLAELADRYERAARWSEAATMPNIR